MGAVVWTQNFRVRQNIESGKTPTPEDELCLDCVHMESMKGATNETIHATMFARYKASVEYEFPAKTKERDALLETEQLKG